MYPIKIVKNWLQTLSLIYQASTEGAAYTALEVFESKWSKQYPQIAKSWYNHWENLVLFLQYPESIRKIIYTTNAIESLNSQLRVLILSQQSRSKFGLNVVLFLIIPKTICSSLRIG
jgi:transposase-like protein